MKKTGASKVESEAEKRRILSRTVKRERQDLRQNKIEGAGKSVAEEEVEN